MYKLIEWKLPVNRSPEKGIYDPYFLFWTGVIELSYTICAPIPVLLLTLDRICVLRPGELLERLRPGLPNSNKWTNSRQIVSNFSYFCQWQRYDHFVFFWRILCVDTGIAFGDS